MKIVIVIIRNILSLDSYHQYQLPEVVEFPEDVHDVLVLLERTLVVEQDHGRRGQGRLQLEELVQPLLHLRLSQLLLLHLHHELDRLVRVVLFEVLWAVQQSTFRITTMQNYALFRL